jgi:hypothetical protein
MTIEQSDVVDAISTNEEFVNLTISDHLDWDDELEHIYALQEKINAYLSFVESGEILAVYPQAAGKIPVINVFMMVAPNEAGARFFDHIRPILKDAGFELRVRVLDQV